MTGDERQLLSSNRERRLWLWALAVAAYPPYTDYQNKTTRRIPVFRAEPAS